MSQILPVDYVVTSASTVMRLFRGSWLLIRYLSPSLDSPLWVGVCQFLWQGPVLSIQGAHGLRTAFSLLFGTKWEALRVGGFLPEGREGQSRLGNMEAVAWPPEILL